MFILFEADDIRLAISSRHGWRFAGVYTPNLIGTVVKRR
jgi:hypothetical protein